MENAEFARLGSVHRNTFINSPTFLNGTCELKISAGVFFAGQITGVEGYVESTASGLVAGVNAVRYLQGKNPVSFPANTAIGALLNYISEPKENFQPMNVNYGLIPFYAETATQQGGKKRLGKSERRLKTAEHALSELGNFLKSLNET
jgi:methylenetetrahydrofolate--tRNA-(uracil-5-)-methyltransferase